MHTKKPLQKTPNIREMRQFSISAMMEGLLPLQNPHFVSEIKIPGNLSKSIMCTNHAPTSAPAKGYSLCMMADF